ncbi:unnamed protein product [Prorocentrum cordatum]|uniref:Uncharacterized protein n=1 Tax=Prorocentrum cordatum TaxID=2364126 RepID=A0ABN9VAK7_9DINO|nr:unnamed protein product [Polarella glacialis]
MRVPRVALLSACCLAARQRALAWVLPLWGGPGRPEPGAAAGTEGGGRLAGPGAAARARGRLRAGRPLRASFEEFSKKELLQSLRGLGFTQPEWKGLEKLAWRVNVLKDLRLSPAMLMGSRAHRAKTYKEESREGEGREGEIRQVERPLECPAEEGRGDAQRRAPRASPGSGASKG